MAKVSRGDGCHEWTGALFSQTGYGQFAWTSKEPKNAHRVAWELANGPITAGLHVLHKCDNRKCVRLDHLFLGTHSDNMIDMASKGRHVGARGHRQTEQQREKRSSLLRDAWAAYKAGEAGTSRVAVMESRVHERTR